MKAALVAQGNFLPATTMITNGNMPGAMYDALVASAISAHNFYPVLLVKDTSVPAATHNALVELGLTDRYIIGGTGSVKESVRTSLGVPVSKRISGDTRYSTATAVAVKAQSMGWLGNSIVGFAAKIPPVAAIGTFAKINAAARPSRKVA